MKVIKNTEVTNTKPEVVWKIWENVSDWPKWDDELESVKLNGKFETGGTGVLVPKGGAKVNFTLTEVIPGKSFTDVSKLPLCKLTFIHSLETIGDKTYLTHDVSMSGPLTFLFYNIIGRKIQKFLPTAMKQLVKMAEQEEINV